MGCLKNVRSIFPEPHDLVNRVHGVKRHARDLEDPFSPEPALPPFELGDRALVERHHNVVQRLAVSVDRRDTLSLTGHAERGGRIVPQLRADRQQHVLGALPNRMGAQLGPPRFGVLQRILPIGCGQLVAFLSEGHCLTARCANI